LSKQIPLMEMMMMMAETQSNTMNV